MSLERDLESLNRVALFSTLGTDEVRHLAFGTEPVTLGAGRWLFREGQLADAAYVLVSGAVLLNVEEHALTNGEGERSDQAGTLFGETALITEKRWQQSAITVEPSELLRIPRSLFLRVLGEYPDSADRLRRMLAERLSRTVSGWVLPKSR